jgi:hypothetical protein
MAAPAVAASQRIAKVKIFVALIVGAILGFLNLPLSPWLPPIIGMAVAHLAGLAIKGATPLKSAVGEAAVPTFASVLLAWTLGYNFFHVPAFAGFALLSGQGIAEQKDQTL